MSEMALITRIGSSRYKRIAIILSRQVKAGSILILSSVLI